MGTGIDKLHVGISQCRAAFPIFAYRQIPRYVCKIPMSIASGILMQIIDFVLEEAIDFCKRPPSEKFPFIFPVIGNFGVETGSIRTASATTQSRERGDFLAACEWPPIGGVCRWRFGLC
jgi:hypothetical protein